MTRRASFVALLAVLAACAGAVQAESLVALGDGRLAESADLIVVGQVVAVEGSPSAEQAVADVTIAVESVIKGELLHSPASLRLRRPATKTGAGSSNLATHLLSLRQRVLLFLDTRQTQVPGIDVVASVGAAFHVFRFGERDVADASFWEGHVPSAEGWGPRGDQKLRDLQAFSHWLRQRVQGQDSVADYWLEADPEALRTTYHEQVRILGADAAAGELKGAQPSAAVSDPAEDVVVINALSNNSPDFVSAQLSSTGTNLRITVRHVPTSFDPAEDQTYLLIDIDSSTATGLGGFNGVGADFLIRILAGQAIVLIWDPPSDRFQELGTFPATNLADGYFASVPLSLLQNDATFVFRFANEVRRDNHHTAFLDYMPDLQLAPGSMSAPATPPAAPAGLQATLVSPDQIALTWTDNSNNEERFEIERRLGGGAFQQVAVVGENTNSWQDTGVGPGTLYGYRVRARNDAGASGFSNTASATTPGEVVPTALTAEPLSTSEIRLSWEDNATSETGYQVEMRPPGGNFGSVQSLPANSDTTVIGGLEEATLYTFRVKATGGSGDSSYSNEASTATFSPPTGPCVAGPTTLCLNQDRFRVEVTWGDFAGNTGPATDVGLVSEDSGLFYFFSPNNWEMLVKVLDGCGLNNRFWVFAAATTDVEYTLRVTDTLTGFVETYLNPLGTAAPAITDTDAFATCAAQPPAGQAPATTSPARNRARESALTHPLESTELHKQATCIPGTDTLCLNQGRFRVEVDWATQAGTGRGTVDAFQSTDSGLFWFFSPENLEMLVKVLDACAINQRVWVFAAATTDVEYTLTVTDTVTGEQKQYFNAAGNAADAVTDTDAFLACP